jgi:hypothetical protein
MTMMLALMIIVMILLAVLTGLCHAAIPMLVLPILAIAKLDANMRLLNAKMKTLVLKILVMLH